MTGGKPQSTDADHGRFDADLPGLSSETSAGGPARDGRYDAAMQAPMGRRARVLGALSGAGASGLAHPDKLRGRGAGHAKDAAHTCRRAGWQAEGPPDPVGPAAGAFIEQNSSVKGRRSAKWG